MPSAKDRTAWRGLAKDGAERMHAGCKFAWSEDATPLGCPKLSEHDVWPVQLAEVVKPEIGVKRCEIGLDGLLLHSDERPVEDERRRQSGEVCASAYGCLDDTRGRCDELRNIPKKCDQMPVLGAIGEVVVEAGEGADVKAASDRHWLEAIKDPFARRIVVQHRLGVALRVRPASGCVGKR